MFLPGLPEMRRLLVFALCLALPVAASGHEGPSSVRGEMKTVNTASFLNAHPDMKYRREGWIAFEEERFAEAAEHFLRASGYADKLSQVMLAEMHWEGRGVARDRALAYAWADLAAERGYPKLIVVRERYWTQLDDAERARALEAGERLYAEYGDDVARPRMARHLLQARRGMVGKLPRRNVEILVPDADGHWARIQGHHFYATKFWEPERYQEWVDQTWTAPPRGTVEVGDPESLQDD